MKKFLALALIVTGFFSAVSAQTKNFTLEEIWGGAFKMESLEAMRAMENGPYYTVLNKNNVTGEQSVDQYEFDTQEKIASLVSTNDLPEGFTISSYKLNYDGRLMLLGTQEKAIYRRSKEGFYFIWNREAQTLTPIADYKIQEPTLSPGGDKVAYGYQNNLYIKDLSSGEVRQLTTDGEKNKIINGITDWVYEEEFSFVRAFDWNAEGTALAYIRFDESEVPEFSMDVYGKALYPTQQVFKYPKAGEPNAEVSLYVHVLEEAAPRKVAVEDAYYLPRLQWTKDADVLSFQVLNRHQNHLRLYHYDVNDNEASVILEEKDKAYVDIHDNLTFLEDHSFIWTSEASGFNHIYHYKKDGTLLRQITEGPWEVTKYYGIDTKTKRVYYQSVERGSVYRDIYSIRLNGKGKQRLTEEAGTHSALFSKDMQYFIDTFSNTTTPNRYALHLSRTGEVVKELVHNRNLLNKVNTYSWSPRVLSEIEVNGNTLNMWMVKPLDFDPNKTYPLLMFQYSGPGSQSVADTWMGTNDYWYQMLANEGYIIACVDGRGTGFKGADFKKMTYLQLGKYEVEDQIEAARKLGSLPYIDENRIGIWGWSYGGFMSSNAILQGANVFSMAIAVAPVTSWRFYDTVYTERYMRTPQENPSGYDENSPLSHTEKLKGAYLLVHGTADDNVHVQNSMRMIESLVQDNKDFDWAIYPDKNHGIYGGKTRLQLYRKMTSFIYENLGNRVNSEALQQAQ